MINNKEIDKMYVYVHFFLVLLMHQVVVMLLFFGYCHFHCFLFILQEILQE